MVNDFDKTVARIAREHSKNVEAAGDFIGPNDMGLSNKLWQVAALLRDYAQKIEDRRGK